MPTDLISSTIAANHVSLQILYVSRGDRNWDTTYYGGPVNLASGFCFDKETSNGNDEGSSIAHDVILPLERLELLGVVVLEQGHVHIDRHSQVPKCIGSQKPTTH